MTTTGIHAPPTTGERFQSIFMVGFARVTAVWQAAKNRRSIGRLAEWDDHLLRDIGLTRGDVTSALATPLTEDPSRQLRQLSSERRNAMRVGTHERNVRRRLGIET